MNESGFCQMDELGSEDGQGKCSPFGRNLLELAEGPDWAELLRRYCRWELNPRPEQSRGNSLAVRFSQHGGSHHPAIFGFLAHWRRSLTPGMAAHAWTDIAAGLIFRR